MVHKVVIQILGSHTLKTVGYKVLKSTVIAIDSLNVKQAIATFLSGNTDMI